MGFWSVNRKCDKCNRPATVHEVEIVKGQKLEKHLCEQHALEDGVGVGAGYTSINELLTNFVKTHSGMETKQDMACEHCGMTFNDFCEHAVLGCPQCYQAFEAPMSPLLERAHEGATHHLGKVPHRSSGDGEQRQEQLLRLRLRLADAVVAEDYELAAKLRDAIEMFESPTP